MRPPAEASPSEEEVHMIDYYDDRKQQQLIGENNKVVSDTTEN
jgi:hypothetical protein